MEQNQEKLTDEAIAKMVQRGEREAFGWLLERYEEKMKRYARRFLSSEEDISDITQEIFIKVYKNIQQFNPARPFKPWLYRVAHNELVNFFKKKKKDPLLFFDLDVYFPQFFSTRRTEEDSRRKEIKETVEHCLTKIDFKYREVLVLYYLEELSYKEIADIMKIPIATVGVRLRRGRSLLKDLYQNNHGETIS